MNFLGLYSNLVCGRSAVLSLIPSIIQSPLVSWSSQSTWRFREEWTLRSSAKSNMTPLSFPSWRGSKTMESYLMMRGIKSETQFIFNTFMKTVEKKKQIKKMHHPSVIFCWQVCGGYRQSDHQRRDRRRWGHLHLHHEHYSGPGLSQCHAHCRRYVHRWGQGCECAHFVNDSDSNQAQMKFLSPLSGW